MQILFPTLMLLLVFTSFNSSGHVKLGMDEGRALVDCNQSAAEQETLIREAEKGRFSLRRLELMGNVSTADEALHRRVASRMAEGDLFSRRNLIASLKNVSRLKTIYPVTMKNVVVLLDSVEKTSDLRICFKERPQSVHRAS